MEEALSNMLNLEPDHLILECRVFSSSLVRLFLRGTLKKIIREVYNRNASARVHDETLFKKTINDAGYQIKEKEPAGQKLGTSKYIYRIDKV